MPRRNPEDIDLGLIKADLEFLIERTERFRRQQALKPLHTIIGSAGIAIAWIELLWRHCLWLIKNTVNDWFAGREEI
jgi:hypothetical protein